MVLRAKKPVVKSPRLKVLLYSGEGAGKTHFCCSFPDTYYIDTEGLDDYPHFGEMIEKNGGDIIYLTELNEIISEVRDLISTKHNYKTLVIDSISFPYGYLAQMEVDRLIKKSPNTEGTEFGANLAKAKRLTFQLGILLSRLDMNVIVSAHERIKYQDNKEIGKTYDITDKMAYSLGAVWNLKIMGQNRKLFINKSRYPLLKTGDSIDFNDGYKTIENLFGEFIFRKECLSEELASIDQIEEFNRLSILLNVSEERINKLLTNSKSTTLKEMSKSNIQKCIDHFNLQIKGDK